jgi:hypothetical protein
MINDTFSIKKCSEHCFHPRFFFFLHSHFLSFSVLLCYSNTYRLDKHSSSYAHFNISNISVPVFFDLTQNLIAALFFRFETFDTTKILTSQQQLQSPYHQPNTLKLVHHINKRSV